MTSTVFTLLSESARVHHSNGREIPLGAPLRDRVRESLIGIAVTGREDFFQELHVVLLVALQAVVADRVLELRQKGLVPGDLHRLRELNLRLFGLAKAMEIAG